jgi:hypothetical protein
MASQQIIKQSYHGAGRDNSPHNDAPQQTAKAKRSRKKKMEYKEVTLRDGTTFKGMMKPVQGSGPFASA